MFNMIFNLTKRFCTKNIFAICILLVSSGCGSLRTIPPGSEYSLKNNKRYENTYCDTIPRIYSGLSLDICMTFIGPPTIKYDKNKEFKVTNSTNEFDEFDENNFYGYLLDMSICFGIDTLALPYTIMRQINNGNMHLKRKDE